MRTFENIKDERLLTRFIPRTNIQNTLQNIKYYRTRSLINRYKTHKQSMTKLNICIKE